MNDPYNGFIELFREEGKFYNEPAFFCAKVTSKLPDIKIKLNDIELDKDSLLINYLLLDRYVESSEGDTSHNHKISSNLNIGDTVIVFRDGEKFIINSKVVSI